jgi:hypothetical protein
VLSEEREAVETDSGGHDVSSVGIGFWIRDCEPKNQRKLRRRIEINQRRKKRWK